MESLFCKDGFISQLAQGLGDGFIPTAGVGHPDQILFYEIFQGCDLSGWRGLSGRVLRGNSKLSGKTPTRANNKSPR